MRILATQLVIAGATGFLSTLSLVIVPTLFQRFQLTVLQVGYYLAIIGLLSLLVNPVILFIAMFLIGRGFDLRQSYIGAFVSLLLGYLIGYIAGSLAASAVGYALNPELVTLLFAVAGLLRVVGEVFSGIVFAMGALSLGYFSSPRSRDQPLASESPVS